MKKEIDTLNMFAVGTTGSKVVVINPPVGRITKEEALNFAAYLISCTNASEEEFLEVLNAVQST